MNTLTNKKDFNTIGDFEDRIRLLEVKIKILEVLLTNTIPDYSEEILKVY